MHVIAASLPYWLMWVASRRFWYVVAWVVALFVAGWRLHHARQEFANKPEWPAERFRPDGNRGHAYIDFGGQWVMARMLITGNGRHLYDRSVQWPLVRQSFPTADESPKQLRFSSPDTTDRSDASDDELEHDCERLMRCFMGKDWDHWPLVGRVVVAPLAQIGPGGNPFAAAFGSHYAPTFLPAETASEVTRKRVGGPLYPPVQAFIYGPLALLKPLDAYFLFQFLAVGFGFLAGAGVSYGTHRRVWWPLASTLFFLFPGCRPGLDLGQNPLLTAAIVVWGWALAARGRDGTGGAVWGLLAFKPVWGLAFVLVPLLGRRWKFVLTMAGTGVGLAAATIPVVGIQTWKDWLDVGTTAEANYKVNNAWNHLSRDTQGIVRRLCLDFSKPQEQRDEVWITQLSWAVLGATVLLTAAVYLTRADRRRPWGLGAAFAFFGAYLSCYRFMYYDALLAGVGWLCLFADRSAWMPAAESCRRAVTNFAESVPVLLLAIVLFTENVIWTWVVQATVLAEGFGTRQVRFSIAYDYAWDTIVTAVIWLWCGWRLIVGDESTPEGGEGSPDVGGPHERFADEHRMNPGRG